MVTINRLHGLHANQTQTNNEMFAFPAISGVGLALEASKTLQAGETLLISKPVAVVPRSDEAAAVLAEEAAAASSSGNWVIPLDEEIEAVAAAIGNAGSRTQVQISSWAQLKAFDILM
jgi:hypothetical protein